MRISKKIFAGIIAAALAFTVVPAMPAKAEVKYSGTYTKLIEIEKQEIPDSANSAASNSAATTPAGQTGTTPTQVNSETETELAIQQETVSVMPKMSFVIAAELDGKIIKTTSNKSKFKYKSSNKKIAKVTKKGIVTTLKKGKCDITVTSKKDGTQYVLHLNVAKKVKVTKPKLSAKSKVFEEKKKNKFTLTATVKPSKYADVPLRWYSTDKAVATVDERGNVVTKGYGSCSIVCVAGSNNKRATCSVKVVSPYKEPETGGNDTGKVVDLSQFNTVNDWKELKDNCDAVIIRVGGRYYGGGAVFEDSKWRNHVYNCQQYGIPYSFYFYTNAVSATEGAEEANFIAARVSGHDRALPVFMDSEISPSKNGRADNISNAERTSALKSACQTLQSKGITPGIYGSTNWLEYKMNMSDLPYATWVAQYGPSCTYSGDKLLWQFTSRGQGYGVNAGVDVSYWYK
jgi:GH25 family lysozyme M1 (1,4-beta-N-acetylmuramidase)